MSLVTEKILERMKAKGLSIAHLERRAGLSIHSVRKFLKGKTKRHRPDFLESIAEALECSVSDFDHAPAAYSSLYLERERGKRKKKILIEDIQLMRDCSFALFTLLKEKEDGFSIEEYLEKLGALYSFSSYRNSKEVDLRFARWVAKDGP